MHLDLHTEYWYRELKFEHFLYSLGYRNVLNYRQRGLGFSAIIMDFMCG